MLQAYTGYRHEQRHRLFFVAFVFPTVDLMIFDSSIHFVYSSRRALTMLYKMITPYALKVQDQGGFLVHFTLLLPITE